VKQTSQTQLSKRTTSAKKSNARMSHQAKNAGTLEGLYDDSKDYLARARDYVAEHPVETAALAVVGAGIIWAIVLTKPGATIIAAGSAAIKPIVGKWFSSESEPAGVRL
jgi:ElaB/YqjD/DUF883 family membrane-anchored ribosome-binding protein